VVIKITDFGIAKILDAQGVTSTGQVLGSPAHMAPEQIEGGEVDARTDVFALGVLMYECLVGHLPFEGKNPAQVLRRVLEGLYPAADRERPTVGGRWARILARALSREAAERTPSAAALGAEIKAELEALGIADPRAEVVAYFADPAAYTAAHPGRLTPRVVARGEAARKAGDVPGAAADFNRALALSPTDLAILKRLSSLNQAAGRRLLLRRAAAILAGSAVLGLAAFQIARALKPGPIRHDAAGPQETSAPEGSSPRFASDGPAPSGEASAAPLTPTPAPVETTSRRTRIPASPTFTPAPPPATPGTRTVVFNLSPKGAKLTVDGALRPWLGGVSLPVGTHTVVVSPNVQRCCKKLSQTVTVEPAPAGQPDLVQKISLAMEINPATVTLAGAPPNGQLSCPELALTCFAGSQKLVRLNDATWTGSCTFAAPDKPARSARVTINAGENNAVPWPLE
jgi:serine/threonine-protein kinase